MTNEQIEQALQRVRDVLGNDVIGRDLVADIENPTKSNATFLYVSKDPASGDYASVGAALAAITDASASNPYVIQVGPGVFEEDTIDLNAKPHVDVRGSSVRRTIIKPASALQSVVFQMGGANEISDLTIDGNSTADYAISSLDMGGGGGYPQGLLSRLFIKNADKLIHHKNTVASPYGSILKIKDIEFNGAYSEGLFVEAASGVQWTGAIVQNLLAYTNAPANVLHTAGTQNAVIKAIGPCTIEDYSGGNSNGVLMNGGYVELSNLTALFFGKAISILDSADAPDMRMTNTKLLVNTVDFENLDASATGIFSGIAVASKVSNASSSLIMSYADPSTGNHNFSGDQWQLSGGMLPAAVAPLADPPTATAEDVANAVNSIISSLQAAGLMDT